MNNFLQTREQVNSATQWLKDNGYISHPISCKDWELANVIQSIDNGDMLDMGADGSFVLHNALIKGIEGRKVGIDLYEVTGVNRAQSAEYFIGDLMKTEFEDNSFDTIVSLSVIEHDVKFINFAKECSRLLRTGGNLFVSFDYSPTKIDTSLTKLYSLNWNILCYDDVVILVYECMKYGLEISGDIDLTIKDMVITPQYCSPANCSYTFGLLNFIKK